MTTLKTADGHPLSCTGHPDGAGHLIGLNSRPGGWPERFAELARTALHHTTVEDESDPARAERYRAQLEVALAVLDRAHAQPTAVMVTVSDDEWAALIDCLRDAAEYMCLNNYDSDGDFPDDQRAAIIFCHGGTASMWGLDMCETAWHGGPPRTSQEAPVA